MEDFVCIASAVSELRNKYYEEAKKDIDRIISKGDRYDRVAAAEVCTRINREAYYKIHALYDLLLECEAIDIHEWSALCDSLRVKRENIFRQFESSIWKDEEK